MALFVFRFAGLRLAEIDTQFFPGGGQAWAELVMHARGDYAANELENLISPRVHCRCVDWCGVPLAIVT
jgi:hypothetical protein